MNPVRLRIHHETRFGYADTVTHGYSEARLLPRATPHQIVQSAELLVDPLPDDRSARVDHFGNTVVYLAMARPHHELAVTAEAEVEVGPRVVGPAGHEPWEAAVGLGPEAIQFTLPSPLVEPDAEVEAYARRSFPPGRPLAEAAAELTERIYADLDYRPGATSVLTPVGEVMARRKGVCQDFAHLQIACLRSLGLAARYVSGHLETTLPGSAGPDGAPLVGAGASHAWLAVALPDGTWLDLDPTNRLVAPATHVTLAWGRDYTDVAPLKGVVFTEGGHSLSVTVTVTRV